VRRIEKGLGGVTAEKIAAEKARRQKSKRKKRARQKYSKVSGTTEERFE
jgi:hypothetical protein